MVPLQNTSGALRAPGADVNLTEQVPVSYETWRKLVELELGGASFDRKLVTQLYEGLALQPLYTDADTTSLAGGLPSMMPYVRGCGTLVSCAAPDLVQECREPTPSLLRSRVLEEVSGGAKGVRLRLDRVARAGLDATSPDSEQLIGKDGCCIYGVEDLADAFADVDVATTHVGIDAGANFLAGAQMLNALWEARSCAPPLVRGAFEADPLGSLAREGLLPMTLPQSFDNLAATVTLAERWPGVTALGVSTSAYHDAGATSVHDIAYALATGLEYLRALDARGLSANRVAAQFKFHFSVDPQVFPTIAMLRAARGLWARLLEECGVDAPRRGLTSAVQMGRRTLTKREPWVNLLRNTTCVFAAIVGGANEIGSVAFDDALGLPSPVGRRIARLTTVVLQEEAHLARVLDPGGGSYLLEKLTSELAEKAWTEFREVERVGGMARALSSGWLQPRIDAAAASRRKNIATRRDVIVGVSDFAVPEETLPREASHVDYATVRQEVLARVESRRRHVGAGATDQSLRPANGLTASATAATQWLRLPTPLVPRPFAEGYERLREAADLHLEKCGVRPRVYLANLGPLSEHNIRSSFARSLFEAGGFEVLSHPGSGDPDELAHAFEASGTGTVVICSSDALYEKSAEAAARALKKRGARHVVLAGNPGTFEARYRDAGVDRFVFHRCDAVSTLQEVLKVEGVEL